MVGEFLKDVSQGRFSKTFLKDVSQGRFSGTFLRDVSQGRFSGTFLNLAETALRRQPCGDSPAETTLRNVHLVESKFNAAISQPKPLRSRWQEQQDEVGDFFPSLCGLKGCPGQPFDGTLYKLIFNLGQDSRKTSRPDLLCVLPCHPLSSSSTASAHPSLPNYPTSAQFLPHGTDQGYMPPCFHLSSTSPACSLNCIIQLCTLGLEVPFP
ncbi:hypothetical protein BGX38DRAFT_1332956, partial [Terfezia claveryi]